MRVVTLVVVLSTLLLIVNLKKIKVAFIETEKLTSVLSHTVNNSIGNWLSSTLHVTNTHAVRILHHFQDCELSFSDIKYKTQPDWFKYHNEADNLWYTLNSFRIKFFAWINSKFKINALLNVNITSEQDTSLSNVVLKCFKWFQWFMSHFKFYTRIIHNIIPSKSLTCSDDFKRALKNNISDSALLWFDIAIHHKLYTWNRPVISYLCVNPSESPTWQKDFRRTRKDAIISDILCSHTSLLFIFAMSHSHQPCGELSETRWMNNSFTFLPPKPDPHALNIKQVRSINNPLNVPATNGRHFVNKCVDNVYPAVITGQALSRSPGRHAPELCDPIVGGTSRNKASTHI